MNDDDMLCKLKAYTKTNNHFTTKLNKRNGTNYDNHKTPDTQALIFLRAALVNPYFDEEAKYYQKCLDAELKKLKH